MAHGLKRGFFSSSSSSQHGSRTLVVHELKPSSECSVPLPQPPSDNGRFQARTEATVQGQPLITVSEDQTVIWEDEPLILLADSRIDNAPFFGYFPPNSPTPEMVIIDQNIDVIVNAASWKIWTEAPPVVSAGDLLPFEVKAVEGKGMAMIAARDIKLGELIHKERPISVSIQTYNVAPDQGHKTGDFYRSALCRLGRAQQQAILSLSNCWGGLKDVVPGTLATNYLPVDMQEQPDSTGPTYCGCFATLSRANHSCAPNTNYFFQFRDFTGRFYATRDIKAGEEITIMYCDLLQTQEGRREALYRSHRFVCSCDFCSTPPTSIQTKNSNSNRLYIKNVIQRLASSSATRLINADEIRKAILLAEQEALIPYKAQLLYLGEVSLMRGGRQTTIEGARWLEQAKELYQAMEGSDSYHVSQIGQYIREGI